MGPSETPRGKRTREANGVTGAAGGSELERGPEVPDVAGKSLEGAVRIISEAGFVVAAIKTRAGQGAPETAIRTGPPAKPGVPMILTMDGGSTGASSRAQDSSASVDTS